MDEKLNKILNRIGVDKKYFEEFSNAKLYDVNVDDLDNVISIKIGNDSDISCSFYNELIDKFKKYFDGATIKLKIVNQLGNCYHFKIGRAHV